MPPEAYRVLCLLCYGICVLSQFSRGREEREVGEGESHSYCAALVNRSSSGYNRSLCSTADISYNCMYSQDLVTIESDPISHVGAHSKIRVEIKANATAGQDVFFYAFCLKYNGTYESILMACTDGGSEVNISHKWEHSGMAQLLVQVFSPDFKTFPLGCNRTSTRVAANFGLDLDVKIYDSLHPLSSTTSSSQSSLASPGPSSGNGTTPHIIGNITFVPKPSVYIDANNSFTIYKFIYAYNYGDNSSIEEGSYLNVTHLYPRPDNYSFSVQAFAVNMKNHSKAYFKMYRGTLVILEPISNVTMEFNHNNSIKVNNKVYLHIDTAGSLPILVCLRIQALNPTLPMTTRDSQFSPTSVCLSMNTANSMSYEMTFEMRGRFKIVSTLSNNVSSVNYSYTFQVIPVSKPSVVATTTSAGVVFGIVVAIVIILVIMAVGGYLPYRNYKNKMVETADFRFVDLSDKKLSVWKKFKLKAAKVYAHIRPQRNTGKIGLVNLISGPHYESQSSSSSSSTSSYRTF